MKYTIGYPAGEKNFFLSYEPSVSADLLEQELERVKPRDLKQCQTSVGPHRDDLLFFHCSVDIRKFVHRAAENLCTLFEVIRDRAGEKINS